MKVKKQRYIVVAGGVMSGVGKGVATASIGKILQEYGFKTTAIKIDPYINYDAGTLRPTEHGEVWVTDDGGEIDQDLGNYERFLGMELPKKNNITTGQIYKAVIDRERQGEYLGQTVQFIPHIPDEIKRRIREAGKGYDFVLVEIGGTIGDYENIPFLFAMKSMEREVGGKNVVYVLITYLPVPTHIEEMKTKPTQQAIKMLNESGIFPDFILCRAKRPLDDVRKKKIEIYANIDADYVISAPDIKTLYAIPLNFEKEDMGQKILKKFGLKPRKRPNWKKWRELVDRIEHPHRVLRVAMVGKYVDIGDYTLKDSYISVNQALEHAGAHLGVGVEINWIDAKRLEKEKAEVKALAGYHGIIIPGGFGISGVEGKLQAIRFARENGIPFLGLCYGMQLAIVEFARNVCSLEGANSTEVDPNTRYPVVDLLPTQRELMNRREYGGTMRLGAYAAMLREGSRVLELYEGTGRLIADMEKIQMWKEDPQQRFRLGLLQEDSKAVLERHRHRYEVSPEFIHLLEEHGLVFSGYHIREDETQLMEFMELPEHKYFVATQTHPEFKSRLEDPAPLFYGFVKAAMDAH